MFMPLYQPLVKGYTDSNGFYIVPLEVTNRPLTRVLWDGSKFTSGYAPSNNTFYNYQSLDGYDWQKGDLINYDPPIVGTQTVAPPTYYLNGKYISSNAFGDYIQVSTDMITWTKVAYPSSVNGFSLRIFISNGRALLLFTYNVSSDRRYKIFATTDFSTFELRSESDSFTFQNGRIINDELYVTKTPELDGNFSYKTANGVDFVVYDPMFDDLGVNRRIDYFRTVFFKNAYFNVQTQLTEPTSGTTMRVFKSIDNTNWDMITNTAAMFNTNITFNTDLRLDNLAVGANSCIWINSLRTSDTNNRQLTMTKDFLSFTTFETEIVNQSSPSVTYGDGKFIITASQSGFGNGLMIMTHPDNF